MVCEVNDKHNFFFFFFFFKAIALTANETLGGMLQLQWTGLRAPSLPETITRWSRSTAAASAMEMKSVRETVIWLPPLSSQSTAQTFQACFFRYDSDY